MAGFATDLGPALILRPAAASGGDINEIPRQFLYSEESKERWSPRESIGYKEIDPMDEKTKMLLQKQGLIELSDRVDKPMTELVDKAPAEDDFGYAYQNANITIDPTIGRLGSQAPFDPTPENMEALKNAKSVTVHDIRTGEQLTGKDLEPQEIFKYPKMVAVSANGYMYDPHNPLQPMFGVMQIDKVAVLDALNDACVLRESVGLGIHSLVREGTPASFNQAKILIDFLTEYETQFPNKRGK